MHKDICASRFFFYILCSFLFGWGWLKGGGGQDKGNNQAGPVSQVDRERGGGGGGIEEREK